MKTPAAHLSLALLTSNGVSHLPVFNLPTDAPPHLPVRTPHPISPHPSASIQRLQEISEKETSPETVAQMTSNVCQGRRLDFVSPPGSPQRTTISTVNSHELCTEAEVVGDTKEGSFAPRARKVQDGEYPHGQFPETTSVTAFLHNKLCQAERNHLLRSDPDDPIAGGP